MCSNLLQKHLKTPDIVIGADTIVVRGRSYYFVCLHSAEFVNFFLNIALIFLQAVDGKILEKPVDKKDAYRMLSRSELFTSYLNVNIAN